MSKYKWITTVVILILVFICNLIKAQSADIESIPVEGQIKWSNDSIKFFPNKVVIQSKYDPTYIRFLDVDSLGHFSSILPVGEYVANTLSKYHWQRNWDQGFIRINDYTSKIIFKIDATVPVVSQTMILDTISNNFEIPSKGILNQFNDSKKHELDSFILDQLDYYQVPGASLAIVKDGKVIYHKNYGVKNPLTKVKVDNTTLFEAGSITKPVFSFAVLRLVEKGIIDLDIPLYKYLPYDDVSYDERYKLITARHVLSHQTGFPNWAERNENGQFDLLFEPGTQFGYSGEGFEYLKDVVTHLTNKDIMTILKEELIEPLDLKNFYFKRDEYTNANASDALNLYTPEKAGFEKPNMAASLMTTTIDFTRFMIGIEDRVGLSESTYEEMFSKQVSVNENVSYGLGIELSRDNVGNFYEHTGVTKNFVSMYRYYPDLDTGFIFFSNNITGGWLTINTLRQYLITGKVN
ncbi:serine hydrolase [Lewinella sp. JB7]|uniref:serine hydrolase domain-containing protein n=1 Tax=Lewinella sp. JB7 TaxID=2962887 RepID=UPI0020C9C95B|nr:serine hydrolase domain-containing protein [Lewinella sp. JB7]MCP9237976.1 beta-lactamase family protein [Lewinella sp. JB7]